jgi:hypothetical protein
MLDLDITLDEDQPRGRELLFELASAEDETGFPAPPVPNELLDELRIVGEGTFGTREPDRPLLDIDAWVAEACEGDPSGSGPYLLYGRDGRGVTRQFVHYYLSCGPLALFLQRQTDPLADVPTTPGLAEALSRVPPLLDTLEAARAQGSLAADERCVLVDSDLVGSRWARLRPGMTPPAWRDRGGDPFFSIALELAD